VSVSRRAIVFGGVGLALASCRKTESPGSSPLVVFAAASLREVITALGGVFERNSGTKVTTVFEATSRLAKQIEEGARCDVFLSADEVWMDALATKGLVLPSSRRDVASTELVVVVPREGAASLASPQDLARVKRLAVAGENVPAGRYARAALASTGVMSSVSASLVSGDSVRVALEWVASGSADAGIVYATDARIEPKVRVAFTFAPGTHPKIRYPAAISKASEGRKEARAFFDLLLSADGKRVFAEAGFHEP
jgi:molybdate transport system substrate-binding protein